MVHLQSGLYCRCFICVHFRWTQCVLCVWLHLIEVCFLFICLWQRSQIQMTVVCLFVRVVRPGFDSTSPAFVRSRASQAAGSDGRLSQKNGIGPPSLVGRDCAEKICADVCSSPTSCKLCLLGPYSFHLWHCFTTYPGSWRSFTTYSGSRYSSTTYPGTGYSFPTHPWSGPSYTTYPDRDAVLRHTHIWTQFYEMPRVGKQFYDIHRSGCSFTTSQGRDAILILPLPITTYFSINQNPHYQ